MQPASMEIWDQKYRLKGNDGAILDRDIDGTWKRVARALADIEATPELREQWYERFLRALRQGAIPAGRIIANAGAHAYKPATSTINCTVSGTIRDSMDDILGKLHEAGMTLKSGCGIGYEFSTLRPRGAYVSGAGAYTSGPLSFMEIYDKMCFTISSAGGRRGAQMATFDIGHPDVMEFIRAKRADGTLRQFNLSLLITSEFMAAVQNDDRWPLAFPITDVEVAQGTVDLNDPEQVLWRDWPNTEGYLTNDAGQVACRIYKTIPARRLWDVIMASTYDYAEPGFILIDQYNEMNNNWFCENVRATNPCGEQGLPPYGACWTGDMRIQTNFGLIRTEDAYAMVRQGQPLQIAVDDRFGGEKTDLRPCMLVENGQREVSEILFDNGQRIKLTADHRVSTPQGWREAGDLAIGDGVHIQSKELSSLKLIPPFYLGVLKYLTECHQGEEIVVTRQSRRAFLKPVLDMLRINYRERVKGLFIARNHPVMQEVERLEPAQMERSAAEGYLYAAQATAGRYRDCPAAYGPEFVCRQIESAARLLGCEATVTHHGNGTFRALLPKTVIRAPATSERDLDLEFGLYGWLLADGWLTDSTGLLFSDEDDAAQRLLAPLFQAKTGTAGVLRETYQGQKHNVYSIACYREDSVSRLKTELGLGGYRSKEIRVPEKVFRAPTNQQASFLAAIFCADGSIDANRLSIRLVSASREFLEDVQLLLLNFGIHGAIMSAVSNGNTFYTLRLWQQDAYHFYSFIGFPFNTRKQHQLERLLVEQERWREAQTEYTARVVSIRPQGVQTVYDIEEFSTHTLVVNGMVIHNCLLGSINLTRFVVDPFTDQARFDWDGFGETVLVFTRMLDNVVEVNGLPLAEQREEILRKRRHGMGYLGLGSSVTMLGMKYGDEASLEFTERVTREMALAGWRAGLELAREKGPAPIMEEEFPVTAKMLRQRPEMARDGFRQGDRVKGRVLHARYSRYMQRIAEVEPELVEAIAAEGCRFTHHSSIAPTGTISLSLANNASNGIEPSFAHHYARNVIRSGKKSKEKVDVFSYELLAYRELVNPRAMPYSENPDQQLPDYFITADDITPKAHVDVQAAAQKWIDSSISKTANVPTDYPFDAFKDIYLYAWQRGLKGCTTFRFNPEAFQGVLVKEKDLAGTTYRFALEDGAVIEAKGNEEVEYDGETHTAANLYDALKEGYYGKF